MKSFTLFQKQVPAGGARSTSSPLQSPAVFPFGLVGSPALSRQLCFINNPAVPWILCHSPPYWQSLEFLRHLAMRVPHRSSLRKAEYSVRPGVNWGSVFHICLSVWVSDFLFSLSLTPLCLTQHSLDVRQDDTQKHKQFLSSSCSA